MPNPPVSGVLGFCGGAWRVFPASGAGLRSVASHPLNEELFMLELPLILPCYLSSKSFCLFVLSALLFKSFSISFTDRF